MNFIQNAYGIFSIPEETEYRLSNFQNRTKAAQWKTKKKRKQLSINLGSYHDEWIKISRQYNVRPATFAAALIKSSIASSKLQQNNDSYLKGLAEYLSPEETQQFKVILRKDEVAALDRFAAHLGLSKTQAIRALTKYFTTNEPQYTLDELDALETSNEEMRMIESISTRLPVKLTQWM